MELVEYAPAALNTIKPAKISSDRDLDSEIAKISEILKDTRTCSLSKANTLHLIYRNSRLEKKN